MGGHNAKKRQIVRPTESEVRSVFSVDSDTLYFAFEDFS